jgi:hypothetical protein
MSWGAKLRGTGTVRNLPRSIFIAEVSMIAFRTKALPVCRWQSMQWQQCTRIGLFSSS